MMIRTMIRKKIRIATASSASSMLPIMMAGLLVTSLLGCDRSGTSNDAGTADPSGADTPVLASSGQDPVGTSTDRDPLGGLFPFTPSASDTLTQAIAEGRGNAITRAVESASPAVVNITVTELVQSRRSLIDEEFFRFFMNGYDVPREYTSIGSGFIISPDGLVVTNQHVVGNSPSSVTVTLTSGDSYEAEVIGTDELTDLALLRIRGDAARASFPHLRFSDSDKVQVGEWAIALGNPFGLFEDGQPTVTVGVVSARNRDFRPDPSNPRVYMDMIQTDAAINRGNSGGPLLNSEGSVIGINTFIYTGGTGSGFVGLGFAIPSSRIRMIISQLLSDGEIRLDFDPGMSTTSMTEQLVYRYRLPMIQGLLVTEVNRDGPAFQAGILPGDIILQYADERVVSQLHANALLRQYAAGDTLRIELLRNGLRYEAQVLLRDKVMAGQ